MRWSAPASARAAHHPAPPPEVRSPAAALVMEIHWRNGYVTPITAVGVCRRLALPACRTPSSPRHSPLRLPGSRRAPPADRHRETAGDDSREQRGHQRTRILADRVLHRPDQDNEPDCRHGNA